MGKLLVYALIAAALCKFATGRWPWELWRDSERSQGEAQARALLGVDRSASREQVLAAHRQLLIRVHPDRGGSAEQVHQADKARDILLARLDRRITETP
ncbi:molecular chaperone DnaJ [Parablastomonas sp. CN1-191]|uniref:molecular chaperone DnaJ n=1 Tax=Parablastomonas sp. CN1-191 TaxID=3400908 RepID=UPI003BF8B9F9